MYRKDKHPLYRKAGRRFLIPLILLFLLQFIILSLYHAGKPLAAAPFEQADEPEDVISGHNEMEHGDHMSDSAA